MKEWRDCFEEEEKKNEVDWWVKIAFSKRKRGDHPSLVPDETLHIIDIPRSMYDRWSWLFRWREAKYVCQYPRDRVMMSHSYYDKTKMLELGYKKPLTNLISAKAWVTRVKKQIAEYENATKGRLFQDLENDPIYKKLQEKLINKQIKVIEAEEKVKGK